jgi:hypothetical protein
MIDPYFCTSIYIEGFPGGGVADARSAAKRQKSMFERTAGK